MARTRKSTNTARTRSTRPAAPKTIEALLVQTASAQISDFLRKLQGQTLSVEQLFALDKAARNLDSILRPAQPSRSRVKAAAVAATAGEGSAQ